MIETKNKHRILITTLFYNNYNYGAILQAYALYHKLEEMGYSVTELKYDGLALTYKKQRIDKIIRIIKELTNPIDFIDTRLENIREVLSRKKYLNHYPNDPIKNAFDKFIEEEFKTTKLMHTDTISDLPPYDFYITGGDQMWNPLWFDRNYYLNFAKGKKIAFSCSIGKDNLSVSEEKRLLEMIQTIDCLSVREKSAKEWLEKNRLICSRISDPVFLLSLEQWKMMSCDVNKKYSISEPYVFAYLLGDDKHRRNEIKKFAKKNGLAVASVKHPLRKYNPNDESFAEYAFTDIGPREFIYMIRNASVVITDSFHGTAFSILFKKPFFSINRYKSSDNKSMNSRISSILEDYGLMERLVEVDTINMSQICDFNYNYLEDEIEKNRIAAQRYLVDSLI